MLSIYYGEYCLKNLFVHFTFLVIIQISEIALIWLEKKNISKKLPTTTVEYYPKLISDLTQTCEIVFTESYYVWSFSTTHFADICIKRLRKTLKFKSIKMLMLESDWNKYEQNSIFVDNLCHNTKKLCYLLWRKFWLLLPKKCFWKGEWVVICVPAKFKIISYFPDFSRS